MNETLEVVGQVVEQAANPKKKGFAALSPERRKEISALGGRMCHQRGVAHRWTAEEAKKMGSLGGRAPHRVRGRGKKPPTSLPPSED